MATAVIPATQLSSRRDFFVEHLRSPHLMRRAH
jgi:hypothetical protein